MLTPEYFSTNLDSQQAEKRKILESLTELTQKKMISQETFLIARRGFRISMVEIFGVHEYMKSRRKFCAQHFPYVDTLRWPIEHTQAISTKFPAGFIYSWTSIISTILDRDLRRVLKKVPLSVRQSVITLFVVIFNVYKNVY